MAWVKYGWLVHERNTTLALKGKKTWQGKPAEIETSPIEGADVCTPTGIAKRTDQKFYLFFYEGQASGGWFGDQHQWMALDAEGEVVATAPPTPRGQGETERALLEKLGKQYFRNL